MIHLIWSILNTVVVLYFIYLIIGLLVRGKEIFNAKFKALSILIMVIGTVQIISYTTSDKKTNQILLTDDYNRKNDQVLKAVTLDNEMTFDTHISLTYSVDEDTYIPVSGDSYLNGFVSGYEWELHSLNTSSYKKNKKAAFTATGVLKWKLFGIHVYSESKSFSGFIE